MSSKKPFASLWDKLFLVLVLVVLGYHMMIVVWLIGDPIEHQIVSLAMLMTVFFYGAIRTTRNLPFRALLVAALAIGVGACVYLHVNYENLQEIVGFPEKIDMIVGVALIIVILLGTWMAWGAVFPVLALILIAYFFLGHHLPHPLYHSPIPLDLGISYLDMGFTGVFGPLLSVIANFGIILLIFGSLLESAGANRFFLEVGKLAGRKLSSGPGQTAVVGSSLMGMVTGAAVGNVMITGAFTIPMMKKVGYRAEAAAAIEAAASCGSQLMPPVMGIAAFLMAGFLGKDFSEVMIAGIVPSFLYFFSIALGVQLIAIKDGVKRQEMKLDRRALITRSPLFIIPVGLFMFMLLKGLSTGMTAFTVNCLLLVMMFARRETRPPLGLLMQSLSMGLTIGAKITLAIATVGIVAQVIVTTGLAQKLGALVSMISFGIPLVTLFFTMLLSIILGMGLPASGAYALVAILIAPGLIAMGMEDIRAHFFAFYFSIVSAVTPPVALGSLAASSIAGANYMRTSWEAFKLSLPNFITPFLIVYNPVFLLRPGSGVGMGIVSIFFGLGGPGLHELFSIQLPAAPFGAYGAGGNVGDDGPVLWLQLYGRSDLVDPGGGRRRADLDRSPDSKSTKKYGPSLTRPGATARLGGKKMKAMAMKCFKILTLAVLLAMFAAPQFCLAEAPVSLSLLTAPFGSGSYVLGSALEEIVRDSGAGFRISNMETPGVAYNIMKMERNQDARKNTVFISAPTLIEMAQRGMRPFREKMGKDIVSLASVFAAGRWMVSRDKSIKSYHDLKDKTIGIGNKQQTNYGLTPYNEIILGAGLSPKDVDIKWLGTNSSASAFKDRQLDVCVVGGYFNPATRKFFPAPFFNEMMATEKDLNNFGPTREDLQRVRDENKLGYRLYELKPGELAGVNTPIAINMAIGTLAVYKNFPENMAYELTKLLIAKASQFARYHALGKILTKEMLCWGLEPADLHPGAYRAYREADLMK